MAIRWDKFTVKSQEAVQSAGTLAAENGNPELTPMHILAALLEDKDGIIVPVLQKVGVAYRAAAAARERRVEHAAQGLAAPARSRAFQCRCRRCWTGPSRKPQNFKDEYVSTEHLLLALTEQKNDPARDCCWPPSARPMTPILQALTSVRGNAARDRSESRSQVPGARKVRKRPDRARAPRQARSGHRPR